MTVNYKGVDSEFNYRIAEINFSEKEERKMERIASLMYIKGWWIDIVTDGYALCELDNYSQYKDFMRDWKVSKKCIADCIKYGI